MKNVLFWLAILLSVLIASMGAGIAQFMPLEEVKPGMKGNGRTIYRGQNIEGFQCEIIGVLKNMNPNQSAILARLSGGNLEKTGVFAGMSGSPVFIDGKLIGAVAWSLPFLTEPIAGITPIKEIIDVFQEDTPSMKVDSKQGNRSKSSWEALRDLSRQLPVIRTDVAEWGIALPPGMLPAASPIETMRSAAILRPISTPVTFAGFAPAMLQHFAPQFQMLGMTPMQGGSSGARGKLRTDIGLEPGSTIAVSLVSGDMDVSAIGTVTYRDGKTIYAFGHPFLNIGSTDMPLSRAEVLAVIPSLETSQKYSVSTDLVGVIKQDRATGIQGVLGESAKLIPVSISVTNQRGRRRQFSYEVVNDQFLTPLLLNLTIYSTILSSERGVGYSTLQVRGRITLDGQPDINIENCFSSNSNSPVFASLAVAIPVNFLLASGYANLRFKEIAMEITSFEDTRDVLLERVWCDQAEAQPGQEVHLGVSLRKDNGEQIVESYPIKIAEDISPGPLSIMIGDGESLERNDAHEIPNDFIPRDLGQVVKLINNIRKKDRLYVRLFRRERGVVVHGEGLPGLPPSIYALLQSPKSQGGISPIGVAAFIEYELPSTDLVINGMKVLNLQVRP